MPIWCRFSFVCMCVLHACECAEPCACTSTTEAGAGCQVTSTTLCLTALSYGLSLNWEVDISATLAVHQIQDPPASVSPSAGTQGACIRV